MSSTQLSAARLPALLSFALCACGMLLADDLGAPPAAALLLIAVGLPLSLRGCRDQLVTRPGWLLVTVGVGALFAATARLDTVVPYNGHTIRNCEIIGEVVGNQRLVGEGMILRLRPGRLMARGISATLRGDIEVRLERGAVRFGELRLDGASVAVVGDLTSFPRARYRGDRDRRAEAAKRGLAARLVSQRQGALHLRRQSDGLLAGIRLHVDQICRRHIGGEEGDIALALLLGDRSRLDDDTRAAFIGSGTMHVLALSGLHVTVVVLALQVIIGATPLPRRFATLASMILLAAYVVVTGASPSVVRAATMAAAAILARQQYRRSDALNLIGVAGLCIIAVDPSAAAEPGFQLSFGATAALLLLAPDCRRMVDSLSRRCHLGRGARLLELLLISIGVQIATAPILALHGLPMSLIAPVANLVVVPAISLGFGAALLMWGLSLLWEASAALSGAASKLLLISAREATGLFRLEDAALIGGSRIESIALHLVAAALFVSLLAMRGRWRLFPLGLGIVAFLLAIAQSRSQTGAPRGSLLVVPTHRGTMVLAPDAGIVVAARRDSMAAAALARSSSTSKGRRPIRILRPGESLLDRRFRRVIADVAGPPRLVAGADGAYLLVPLRTDSLPACVIAAGDRLIEAE